MADSSTPDSSAVRGAANLPTYESPVTGTYPNAPGAPLVLADQSALTKLVIKAGPDTAAAQQLAVQFGASRSEGNVLILGQRPDEWLVVGDQGPAQRFVSAIDRSGHVSLIDHTHSRGMFRLTGDDAAQMLAKICGLDLNDHMTPNGAVVSASIAKVTCDMARNDKTIDDGSGARSYLLACDRSFGQYLFDAILDAGAEYDIGVDLAAMHS